MKNGFLVFCHTFRVNLRSSVLYSIGVCLSVATALVVGTLTRVAFRNVEQQLDTVVMDGAQVQIPSLPTGVGEKAVTDASVFLSVSPMTVSITSGTAQGGPVSLWGVDSCAGERLSLSWDKGEFFTRASQDAGEHVCAISARTAADCFGTTDVVGCPIQLNVGNICETFRIVGVYHPGYMSGLVDKDTEVVYLPIGVLSRWQGNAYHPAYWVCNQEGIQAFIHILEDRLGEKALIVTDTSAQRKQITDIFQSAQTVLSVLSGVSLVVAAFNLLVITRIHITGRIREIGIKKSIGASNRDLVWEFVIESSAISLIGIVLGVCVDLSLGLFLVMIGAGVGFDWLRALSVCGIVFFLSALFSTIPARRVSRLPVAEILQHEMQ